LLLVDLAYYEVTVESISWRKTREYCYWW